MPPMDDRAGPSPLPQDRSRHAASRVFDALRDEIIALTLPPGAPLVRLELQERFRVSSTPVRDALLRLQEEGLVEIFPQHATMVSLIDIDGARQAQFLRRSIEIEIAGVLAETPDPALAARLRAITEHQEWVAGRGDLNQFSVLDLEFHKVMYEAASVGSLWLLVRRQSGQIDRLRRLHLPVEGKAQQVIDDHFAIIRAIEAGKPGEAQAIVRDHLSKSLAFSSAMRSRYPSYFS
ncbi:GntR family transcriptional regulator [Phreatobacter stygius]|nr:GntR family transcriptional regulator [Phreatobacter stygius]